MTITAPFSSPNVGGPTAIAEANPLPTANSFAPEISVTDTKVGTSLRVSSSPRSKKPCKLLDQLVNKVMNVFKETVNKIGVCPVTPDAVKTPLLWNTCHIQWQNSSYVGSCL